MPCYRFLFLLFCLVLIPLGGCRSNVSGEAADLTSLNPCAVALAPQVEDGRPEIMRPEITRVDAEIARLQRAVRKEKEPQAYIEQLGWRFVEKARLSYDPGYYKIAEQCADCIEAQKPRSVEAMLLRGHVLHSLHRFKEAEEIARELVSKRGLAFDYGLLGDVLMEQGNLQEAVAAYQKMMDLKPGPQAYTRAAHMRWLKGDLDGARELMGMAAQAAGQGDPESAAWAYTRLSLYELQSGSRKKAIEACNAALTLQRDYAPALLACGRVMVADGRESAALSLFQRAAKLNPQPEYQWMLADALRSAKRETEAIEVESQLRARGEAEDPRTYSLFLATRGEQVEIAVRLAEAEHRTRSDVFTIDAVAWALAASGRFDEAHRIMQRALAEGTRDARLFFHAAIIAAKSNHPVDARQYFKKAVGLQFLLSPLEREQLRQLKI
jgi:tetratricopeptide (TPR) repeat protein